MVMREECKGRVTWEQCSLLRSRHGVFVLPEGWECTDFCMMACDIDCSDFRDFKVVVSCSTPGDDVSVEKDAFVDGHSDGRKSVSADLRKELEAFWQEWDYDRELKRARGKRFEVVLGVFGAVLALGAFVVAAGSWLCGFGPH